ncbi:hypothetical protein HK098_002935 [Nowakowskiella sp. JEL0407]|nr:hypothetical protein HK098_002935 [Nowakowskiella sp. JEL0407]
MEDYDVCINCLLEDLPKAADLLRNLVASYKKTSSFRVVIVAFGDVKNQFIDFAVAVAVDLPSFVTCDIFYGGVDTILIAKAHLFVFSAATFAQVLVDGKHFLILTLKIIQKHREEFLPIFFESVDFPWNNHVYWNDWRLDEILLETTTVRSVLRQIFDFYAETLPDMKTFDCTRILRFVDRYHLPVTSSAVWSCAKGLDYHDFFMSHRVQTDHSLVKEITLKLDSINRRHCAFYDKRCLVRGESWIEGFCSALLRSRVAVLFMSIESIDEDEKKVKLLREEDDNMILEWYISYLFQKEGLITIVPVLIENENKQTVEHILKDFREKNSWCASHTFLKNLPKLPIGEVISDIINASRLRETFIIVRRPELNSLSVVDHLIRMAGRAQSLNKVFETRMELFNSWQTKKSDANNADKSLSPAEITSLDDIRLHLRSWQCQNNISRHDFHISKRNYCSQLDGIFLKHLLEDKYIDGRRVHAYLDTYCMIPGCDWYSNVISSLLLSHVVVALISRESLQKIKSAHKVQDHMFLEWELTVWDRPDAFLPILLDFEPKDIDLEDFPQERTCHKYSPKKHKVRETVEKAFSLWDSRLKLPEDLNRSDSTYILNHLIPKLLSFRQQSGLPNTPESDKLCKINTPLKEHSFYFTSFNNERDLESARKLALITDGDMFGHVCFNADCIEGCGRFMAIVYARVAVFIISDATVDMLSGITELTNECCERLIEWNAILRLYDMNLIKVIPVFVGKNGTSFSKFREIGQFGDVMVDINVGGEPISLKGIFRQVMLLHGVFVDYEAVEVPELIRHLGNAEKLSSELVINRQLALKNYKDKLN